MLELCNICNTTEGDDLKAHICLCGECGQEFDGYEPLCECEGSRYGTIAYENQPMKEGESND